MVAAMRPTYGQVAAPIVTHGPFYVRSYIGKCLTYGQPAIDQIYTGGVGRSAAPIFIHDCVQRSRLQSMLQPEVQQIVIEEINARREVLLRAGTRYLGVIGNVPAARLPLELQDYNGGPGQVFALDGDSIIVAADRSLVVEIANGRGANGTALVLGLRDLADTEFWDFNAADGRYRAPTLGFKRVSTTDGLQHALRTAQWGDVIQIERGAQPIRLAHMPTQGIPGGVTLRGNRRGVSPGPELTAAGETAADIELEVQGDYVRITGLQITGPSRSQEGGQPSFTGIAVPGSPRGVIIDNNRLSNWTTAAVNVYLGTDYKWACSPVPAPLVRPNNVLLFRNFIHHNTMDSGGYGISIGGDGSAHIRGNTFLMNRHAIAADGTAGSGYSAFFNVVLSNVPSYSTREEHDFDMHGSDKSGQHTGGTGGSNVEIERNTFLGHNRLNFDLRGVSCGSVRFANNVSQQSHGDALRWYIADPLAMTENPLMTDEQVRHCLAELFPPEDPGSGKDLPVEHRGYCGYQDNPPSTPPVWLTVRTNRFEAPNPTATLGVGDFDGDGRDDLLLATGQAWYYSPGGAVEWRYLNKRTEPISQLRFGDFDGDRRTDVLTKRGSVLAVSWGGASEWETINTSGFPLSDCTVGDFDGNRRADVFCINRVEWFVSYGGIGAFTPYATWHDSLDRLRFGDFNGDGKTDVFGVVDGQWQAVYGGATIKVWTPLRPALTASVQGLVVADFDGDGRADVAQSTRDLIGFRWRISRGGTLGWTDVRTTRSLAGALGVGRFDDDDGADAIFWGQGNERAFDIASSLVYGIHRWSTQEMR